MSDYELEPMLRKKHQFRKLVLARQRVQQLERELRGDPVKPQDPPYVPQFLRVRAANGLAHSPDLAMPPVRTEEAALITKAMNSWECLRPTDGLPAPRRLRLIEGSSARNREFVELQSESCL